MNIKKEIDDFCQNHGLEGFEATAAKTDLLLLFTDYTAYLKDSLIENLENTGGVRQEKREEDNGNT